VVPGAGGLVAGEAGALVDPKGEVVLGAHPLAAIEHPGQHPARLGVPHLAAALERFDRSDPVATAHALLSKDETAVTAVQPAPPLEQPLVSSVVPVLVRELSRGEAGRAEVRRASLVEQAVQRSDPRLGAAVTPARVAELPLLPPPPPPPPPPLPTPPKPL